MQGLAREALMRDERLVSRMLLDWRASVFGEPVLVFDKAGGIVGMTSEVLAGCSPVEIVLHAAPYRT